MTPIQSQTSVTYLPHLAVCQSQPSNPAQGCVRAGVALGCAAASLTPPNVSAASLDRDALRPVADLTMPVAPGNGNLTSINSSLACRLDKDGKVGIHDSTLAISIAINNVSIFLMFPYTSIMPCVFGWCSTRLQWIAKLVDIRLECLVLLFTAEYFEYHALCMLLNTDVPVYLQKQIDPQSSVCFTGEPWELS